MQLLRHIGNNNMISLDVMELYNGVILLSHIMNIQINYSNILPSQYYV